MLARTRPTLRIRPNATAAVMRGVFLLPAGARARLPAGLSRFASVRDCGVVEVLGTSDHEVLALAAAVLVAMAGELPGCAVTVLVCQTPAQSPRRAYRLRISG